MTATVQMGQVSTALLREAWPRHAAKRLARALGIPFDTARNYVAGRSRLTAEALLEAAARDAALLAALETRLHALRTAHLAATPDLAGPRPADAARLVAASAGGPAAVAGGAVPPLMITGGML